jgi:hypothetical protein
MTAEQDTETLLNDQVVHETIDGEAVIIDLTTGSYYSLEGSAAAAWQGLVAGEDAGVTAARIARENGAGEAEVLAALLALHRELHAAGLLRSAPTSTPLPADVGFSFPAVHRYDDMREHLLVDPIHEVERGEGWPTPPSR